MKKYISNFFEKNKKYIIPSAFILGFIIDNFTLTRIDQFFDNLVLFSYLFIASLCIALFSIFESRKLQELPTKIVSWLPVVMQFAFGGLFSGYLIFYTRSATLAVSWFFVLLLFTFFIGNEFLKEKYQQFSFRISVLFLAIFSFAIFYIPILLNTFGAWTFVLSGVVSLFVISFFLLILFKFIPNKIKNSKKVLTLSIGIIYAVMNILYFTNIIPPVPLSLKDAGVYHSLERISNGNYLVKREQKEWYEFFKREKFHRVGSEPVYVYSSVFAPTDIDIEIFHRWQYFDTKKRNWTTSSIIQFPIIGGRDDGYRGYSMKSAVFPAKWRVDVITEREQVIGRVSFEIVNTKSGPVLQSEIK